MAVENVNSKPIAASAATTVFGFFALIFMRFGIGSDLGMNLVKGVTISYISVVVFLPALALRTVKLLDKTAHRRIIAAPHGIGRALVKNPGLILCDEPTGALDYKTSKEVLELMEHVNRKYGCTLVIVTHNAAIARMADRVLRLRDGRLAEDEVNNSPVPASELDW